MTAMTAVVQPALGGPGLLSVEPVARPEPAAGEVLIRVSRAAVNFADERLCRTGFNHFTGRRHDVPFVPGGEITGTVSGSGERVIAFCRAGGYAQYVTADTRLVFGLPDWIDDDAALAVFTPGLTASFLLEETGLPAAGRVVVVHGASGAVGTMLLQLLEGTGCSLVATASSAQSRAVVASRTRATVIDADPDGLADRIRSAAGGEPVDVVLDPVGGRVLENSLAALAPRGRVATYGNASGVAAGVDPRSLIVGTRALSGFWLMDFTGDRAATEANLARLFDMLRAGRLFAPRTRVRPLAEAAEAIGAATRREARSRVLLDPWSGGRADRGASDSA